MTNNEETVTISKELYDELIDSQHLVAAFYIASADSLEHYKGFDEVMRVYKQFQSGEAVLNRTTDCDSSEASTFKSVVLNAKAVEGIDLSNPAEADKLFTEATANGRDTTGRNILTELYCFKRGSHRGHDKETENSRLGLNESELEAWEAYIGECDLPKGTTCVRHFNHEDNSIGG